MAVRAALRPFSSTVTSQTARSFKAEEKVDDKHKKDHNTGSVTSKYVEDTFKKKKSNVEHILMPKIKADGAYLCFPLLLDLSSIYMYLLDGIDVRIRLEMANKD